MHSMRRRRCSIQALKKRIWVFLTEATPDDRGLSGHAHTNDELIGAARAGLHRLRKGIG